jgi:2-oxoisovalerate dehydrogenase E1 component alpha subunit
MLIGFMAKAGEPFSGARQFPLHGAYPKYNIVSLSNVVATQIPQAVGASLASKMRGDKAVTITYFGDGASSQGDCHESMNFAAIHKLPIIFFCENNKFATSVPLNKQMAIDNIAERAKGYGMPGVTIDGANLLLVYKTAKEAIDRARRGDGPTLIEVNIERLMPHTSDDDDTKYRTKEELEYARNYRDPLPILRDYLLSEKILTKTIDEKFIASAKNEVNDATEFAEAAPYPDTDDFYEHVYKSLEN